MSEHVNHDPKNVTPADWLDAQQYLLCTTGPNERDRVNREVDGLATHFARHRLVAEADLAKAKHDATNWQNIAEGRQAELRRLKELAKARLATIKHLNKQLKKPSQTTE